MKTALLAAALVAIVVALAFARPHPTPGPPMRDFEAYYAAGSEWNAGGDPYSAAIWRAERSLSGVDAKRYEPLPFIGPPALLPMFGLIARMPFTVANVVWRCALIAGIAAIALLTLVFAGRALTASSVPAIAVAALGFGPLTSALALGQVALLAFAVVLIAMRWPGASLFAWMQPNVALALLAQIGERRARLATTLGVLIFAGGCFVVTGVSGIVRYAANVHAHSLAERFSAIQVTPASIAYGLGATPAIAIAAGVAVAAGALVFWVRCMRELHAAVERLFITCALLPLALPFFHEHDLLIVFLPAVVYSLRARGAWWFVAAFGACFAATDWLGLAQRPDGTFQTLLLIGAFASAVIVLHERPQRRMAIVPASMLLFIGIASIVAHAHPAPVWPDAMHALPPDVQSLPIAEAWNQEQRASGLFAQEPAWAVLRALSLLGCTLTAVAVYASSRSPARSRSPLPDPA